MLQSNLNSFSKLSLVANVHISCHVSKKARQLCGITLLTIEILISPALQGFLWTVLIYNSGHYIAFSCHISLVLMSETVSQSLSLSLCMHMFNDLWSFKEYWSSIFVERILIWVCLMFSYGHVELRNFLKKDPRSNVSVSSDNTKEYVIWRKFITGSAVLLLYDIT